MSPEKNAPRNGSPESSTADTHKQLLQPMREEQIDPAFLGHDRAVRIVCRCANTIPANLSSTLEELGVDGNSFQTCIFSSVTGLGYSIKIDDIPDAPDTKLIKVVSTIQNAPKSAQ